MRDPDTSIGGPHARFPHTRHSAILGAQGQDPGLRRVAFATIVESYWKPVYKYIRIRWRESNEGAKDLTQAFFAQTLEKGTLTSYDPSRGTFRTWLRTCADNFVVNAKKRDERQKRIVEPAPEEGESMEEIFHREWARSVFSLALEDLRRESLAGGRDMALRIFERYDLTEKRPTYNDLAREFGLTPATLTNYLAAMRRDFRKMVLNKLRELTATDREFRSEARALLGGDRVRR